MAKTKISEYSSTANSNTDIASINIDEGCAPSGINNAIRALMAQIHDLYAGSSGDTWPVTAGGTGSGTASGARTNLGLVIGTDVQAYDADLAAIASSGKGAEIASYGTYGVGFKNRIINGAMMIDQRNAGASVTPSNNNTLDRWGYGNTQTGKFTVQQTPSATETGYATRVAAGFQSYMAATVASAVSVGSGDTFLLNQSIEANNVSDFAWGTANAKTVTLSFLVYSSLTGTFGGAITNYAATRSYPFSYTISSANTWTQISVTIPGDTSGAWVMSGNAGSMIVRFGLGSGSTFSGTANTWATGNLVQPTGTVSVVGTNGATFYITGVQLEKGSTATSFDYRPYGTELALCQRYYQSIPDESIVFTATVNYSSWLFPVTMRATPTVTIIGSTNGTQAVASTTTNGFFATNTGTTGCGYTAAAEL